MNKIILGTAQFGMDYGIHNERGRIPKEEVFQILDKAAIEGIETLDTAYAYGESENIIGGFIKSTGKKMRVITKLPACGHSEVRKMVEESLRSLNSSALEGCLIHNFAHYKEDVGIWDELEGLKREGKVKKIGFSLYHPGELEEIFKEKLKADIVQVPLNIFDRRFSDYLPQTRERGIEVHARSVFLQGLVFEAPQKLGSHFKSIKNTLERLNKISDEASIPLFALCLNFVLQNEFVDHAVVGIDSIGHLDQIVAISNHSVSMNRVNPQLADLRVDDENIILPFNWKDTKI
jgi:aryl-alcohol dehydrogenase-like predicted oxidoreductase